MKYSVIYNTRDLDPEDGRVLFWSNTDGWVDYQSADKFTPEQRASLRLPIGGAWADDFEDVESDLTDDVAIGII